jgi:hypothetical protein
MGLQTPSPSSRAATTSHDNPRAESVQKAFQVGLAPISWPFLQPSSAILGRTPYLPPWLQRRVGIGGRDHMAVVGGPPAGAHLAR